MSELNRLERRELMLEKVKSNAVKHVPTFDDYYDFTNDNRGIAIIFNHESFVDHDLSDVSDRLGTQKDGDDLKAVLQGLKFEVRDYMDLKLNQIQEILINVSMEDHSNNDCLWVTVMSHGKKDGIISAADKDYSVQELWQNFLGKSCKSLIGKPKLFFIQACRGSMVDPGAVIDETDDHSTKKKLNIPNFADLLVMYSTTEGHYSFRNPIYGSWFIQTLCDELKTSSQDDLMRILIRVNKRIAFEKKSNNPEDAEIDAGKQMPNIVSMLTKSIFLSCNSFIPVRINSHNYEPKPKINLPKINDDLCYDISNANRGIALIFYHLFNDKDNIGVQKDADDLKDVLKDLQFDVRVHTNLDVDEMRDVLKKGMTQLGSI